MSNDIPSDDLSAAEIECAERRASAAARSWVVLLISDLSWMLGASEGSGIQIPQRITDDVGEALSWLASQ